MDHVLDNFISGTIAIVCLMIATTVDKHVPDEVLQTDMPENNAHNSTTTISNSSIYANVSSDGVTNKEFDDFTIRKIEIAKTLSFLCGVVLVCMTTQITQEMTRNFICLALHRPYGIIMYFETSDI